MARNVKTLKDDDTAAVQTRTRLTPDEIAEIQSELADGATTAFLAEKYSRSVATINNLRNKTKAASVTKIHGTDSPLKSRLLSYAIASLLNPNSITDEETKALREAVQTDMVERYIKSV